MAINTGKVAVSGGAAGIVLAIIDWLAMKFVMGPMIIADMNSFKAGMGDAMAAQSTFLPMLIMDIIMGILLMWLYAAIRPRFGPGMHTAAYAAIFVWLMGCFFNLNYGFLGMTPWNHWFAQAVIWLVTLVIVAGVGGRIYSEGPATA